MTTQTVSPLPNGRQQFFDTNGAPLIGGTVGTYVPGTLTPKTTYQDSAGSVANANPLTLDSLGSAAIWGNGLYRQIVYDDLGNEIWDQVTYCSVPTVTTVVEPVSSTVLAGSAVGLSTGVTANITSISLAAGTWLVSGNICTVNPGSTVVTYFVGSCSTVSATQATAPNNGGYVIDYPVASAGFYPAFPVGSALLTLTVPTTVYLVVTAGFSTSTLSAYGSINAIPIAT